MLQKTKDQYWIKKANLLDWDLAPKKIFKKKGNNHFYWYPDGKINLYKNLIENKLKKNSKKSCIITINKNGSIERYEYGRINILVDQFLEHFNLFDCKKKKFRAIIHASASVESSIAMLACVKMNIYFSVVFEDLPFDAIKKRIKLFKPNFIFTKSHKSYFHLKNNYKNKVYLLDVNNFKRKKFNKKIKSKKLNSSDNFFSLFTSGSTGSPKGIVHNYGGYSVWCKETCKSQFGINSSSVVLCASDAGWINGHTYSLFGPLFLGATTILLESPLLILNEKILEKIKKLKVTVLYLPVTAIRLLRSITKKKKFIIKSLRALGSMGEPLAPDIGNWFEKYFRNRGRSIVNTYFQTETGGILISPKFNEKSKSSPHGSVGKPVSKYIEISKITDKKKEIKILEPWPGIMCDVLNGKKVWDKYWTKKNEFRMFDLATIENGSIYIHGRTDDVINIRGHRIGSAEIESVLLTNKDVYECCAVSTSDDLEGSKFLVFFVGKKRINTDNLIELIIKNFGTFAIPKKIILLSELPKTRSGKILRRVLRQLVNNDEDIKDTSTMINPYIIKEIKKKLKIKI